MVPHTGKSLRKANLGPSSHQIVSSSSHGSSVKKVVTESGSNANLSAAAASGSGQVGMSGMSKTAKGGTGTRKEISYT